MNCPKCDGVQTDEVEIQSVKVDRCPQCGGTWFEQNELRDAKDRESGGDFGWLDVDLWQDADAVSVDEESRSRCPKDGAAMATVRYGDPEIAVEVCPLCFGLWLDRGEYEKVIDHLAERVDSESVGEYLADAEEEFVELLKGKSEVGKLGRVLHLLRLRFAVEHPTVVTIKEAIRNMFPQ